MSALRADEIVEVGAGSQAEHLACPAGESLIEQSRRILAVKNNKNVAAIGSNTGQTSVAVAAYIELSFDRCVRASTSADGGRPG